MPYKRTDSLHTARLIAQGFHAGHPARMAKVLEFLVFGSTANGGREQVNDLDMLVVFSYGGGDLRSALLPDRLDELQRKHAIRMPLDLTPVHAGYFWHGLARQYYDAMFVPGFFGRVFNSSFLRWEPESDTFERRAGKYLSEKYAAPSSLEEYTIIDRVMSSWIDSLVLGNY